MGGTPRPSEQLDVIHLKKRTAMQVSNGMWPPQLLMTLRSLSEKQSRGWQSGMVMWRSPLPLLPPPPKEVSSMNAMKEEEEDFEWAFLPFLLSCYSPNLLWNWNFCHCLTDQSWQCKHLNFTLHCWPQQTMHSSWVLFNSRKENNHMFYLHFPQHFHG